MSRGLDAFVSAAPWPQRAGLRVLLTLGRRPRGKALLGRLKPIDQLACSLLAMEHYDDPTVSRAVGWDGSAVAERGRALRQREGRP
jgi:hypothetical protein